MPSAATDRPQASRARTTGDRSDAFRLNRTYLIGDGATSAVFAVHESNREDGGSADLDSARALIPAVILGVAFWAIILAIAVLIWG